MIRQNYWLSYSFRTPEGYFYMISLPIDFSCLSNSYLSFRAYREHHLFQEPNSKSDCIILWGPENLASHPLMIFIRVYTGHRSVHPGRPKRLTKTREAGQEPLPPGILGNRRVIRTKVCVWRGVGNRAKWDFLEKLRRKCLWPAMTWA